MSENVKELLWVPIYFLNKFGILKTASYSITQKVLFFFVTALTVFLLTTITVQFLFVENLFEAIDNIEGTVAITQDLGKLLALTLSRNKFLQLIKMSQKFNDTTNSSISIKKEVDGIYHDIKGLQKFYIASFATSGFAAGVLTFFGKPLGLGIWKTENQELLYKIVWSCQFIMIPVLASINACFDCLFLGFCYELRIQCKILRHQFECLSVETLPNSTGFENYSKQLNININHHKFLLNFIREMQNVYSDLFMIQYLTVAPLVCAEMYAFTESDDLVMTVKFGIFECLVATQLAFYCILGNFVMEEAGLISQGLYNSDWYSQYFKNMKVSMVLLIQASQRRVRFSACGLVPMNVGTFVSVSNDTTSPVLTHKDEKFWNKLHNSLFQIRSSNVV